MEFPRIMYRVGTAWALESGRYDLRTVEANEYDDAVLDGWHLDQYAAKAAKEAPMVQEVEEPKDDAPPTRDELEQKARELGLKFDGRTGDKKLAAMIEDALKA